jgi:hypothetical protein
MRRRFVYDPATKEMVEVAAARSQALHFIQTDLPGYESPIDGRWIEGRKARREDLLRSHSRPWEGMEQEKKHAARVQAERDRRDDQLAERMAHRAWAEAPERVREQFRYK